MKILFYSAKRLLAKLGDMLSGSSLSPEDILSLYSSSHHSPHLVRHRASIINDRIRVICWLFSFLILVWIPIDLLLLPFELAGQLLLLRLVTAVIFFAIAMSVKRFNLWEHAQSRLAAMIITPLLFYALVQFLSSDVEVEGMGEILTAIYNLLPFLIVAGLAIFPLTVIEALRIGAASLLIMTLGAFLSQHFSLSSFFPAAWMLLLILGVAMISAAIQLNYMSSLLHRISKDTLTGAFTRQTGQELIDLHFQLSLEEERPFAIAFIDLDFFKSINDVYGHEAGDVALSGAVRALKRMLRRGDHVVRWGGEEFLLLLDGADIKGVKLVLSRIQTEWLGVRPDGEPLTASIGVSERLSDGVDDWLAMVEIADQRMYQAKMTGRAKAIIGEDNS